MLNIIHVAIALKLTLLYRLCENSSMFLQLGNLPDTPDMTISSSVLLGCVRENILGSGGLIRDFGVGAMAVVYSDLHKYRYTTN